MEKVKLYKIKNGISLGVFVKKDYRGNIVLHTGENKVEAFSPDEIQENGEMEVPPLYLQTLNKLRDAYYEVGLS